jgi:hypothetical protein
MIDGMEYELATDVSVEDSILGERFTFKASAGRVKPKNEREEYALAKLAAEQPDVCQPAKPAPKGKG